MKRILLFTALLLGIATASKAQAPASTASQPTNLNLINAIELSFVANSSATGAALNFAFNTVNDYANGL